MRAHRIYTTVFVVNDNEKLVVAVEHAHAEGAIHAVERLNKEFAGKQQPR
jgi:hypothetical protein